MDEDPKLDPLKAQDCTGVPEAQEEEPFAEGALAALPSNVHRLFLQKLDYDSFRTFDETSSLTHAICEQNSFILFPLETDKINFIAGLRTFTLNQALEGQAKLVAKACALPVTNPDFEENYNDLIKNRSEIWLLMLRTSLKGLSLEKFNGLLKAITVEKLSLEGRMGENLLKSGQIQKLKKLVLAQLITVTDELLLEMNPKAPFEVRIERSTLTEIGVAQFIKQFLLSKRSAHILQFPNIWNDLDNLREQFEEYEKRNLSQVEGQETIDRFLEGILMRKPLEAGEDEGFYCKLEKREAFVMEIVSSVEHSIENVADQMSKVSMNAGGAKLADVREELEARRVRAVFIDLDMEKELFEEQLLSEDDKVLFAVKNVDVMEPDKLTRYDRMALVVRRGIVELFLYSKHDEQIRIEPSQNQNSMICYNNFSLLQMGEKLFRTRHSTQDEAQCFRQHLEDNMRESQHWHTFTPNQDLEKVSGFEITPQYLNAMRTLKDAHLEYRECDESKANKEDSDCQSSDDVENGDNNEENEEENISQGRDEENEEESGSQGSDEESEAETNEEYIDSEMKREILEGNLLSENDKVVFAVRNVDVMDPDELTRYERLALVVRKGKLELFLYPKYGEELRIEQSQAQNSMVCYDHYSLLSMRKKIFRTRHSTLEEAEIFQERFGANLVEPQYWLTFVLEQDLDDAVEMWRNIGFDVYQKHITEIRNLRNAYLEDRTDEEDDEEDEDAASTCKAKQMIEYLEFLGQVMPELREELDGHQIHIRSLLSYLQFCLRTLPQHANCRCFDDVDLTDEERKYYLYFHAQVEDRGELGWLNITRLLRKHIKNLENLLNLDEAYAESRREYLTKATNDGADKSGLHEEIVRVFQQKANKIHDELSPEEFRILSSRIPLGRVYSIDYKKDDCLKSLQSLTH